MVLNEYLNTTDISSDFYDTVIDSQNNHNSISEGNDFYDIRSLQETITKRISNIAISGSD